MSAVSASASAGTTSCWMRSTRPRKSTSAAEPLSAATMTSHGKSSARNRFSRIAVTSSFGEPVPGEQRAASLGEPVERGQHGQIAARLDGRGELCRPLRRSRVVRRAGRGC